MLGLFKKKVKSRPQPKQETRFVHYESSTSRLISKLSINGSDIDDAIEQEYLTLQSRARNAYCNNDYVKGFVNQACINVVGHNGIRIQSKSDNEKLNKIIEKQFKKWGKKGSCDVTGNLSFVDIQLLAVKSLLRDGEIFIIKNIIDDRLELQFVEPSKVDAEYSLKLSDNKSIINGVEVNKFGKALAYHFVAENGKRQRVARENIIHVFIQDFIGQKRGISAVATALIRLGLLGQFETAAIDNARQSAKIMAFASKPVNDYEGVTSSYADEEDETQETKEIDFGDGARMAVVDDGLDIKKIDSQFPSSEYGNFKDAILRAISLSLGYGVNFINLGNNLEKVNYSSARQGLLAERDSWRLLQKLMIESLIQPIFEEWLEVEHLSGRVGFISDNKYEDVLDKIRFQPRSWAWIDPLKDAKGLSENLRNKTMSLSESILERGGDPDDVLEQIASDKKLMQKLGIDDEE